jgi:hypothetical protein
LCEGRVENCSPDPVAIDFQSLEERLIERAPTSFVGADVQVVAGGQETKRDFKPFLDKGVVNAGELDQSFGIALFNRQSLLPALQFGDWNGLGEVGIHKLLPVAVEALEAALGPGYSDEHATHAEAVGALVSLVTALIFAFLNEVSKPRTYDDDGFFWPTVVASFFVLYLTTAFFTTMVFS